MSVLSRADLGRILASSNAHHRLAFTLAAFAGLRLGEVRGLRWSDVDLAASVIVVRQAISRGVAAPPKSGHQRRIPLAAELRTMLDAVPEKDRTGFVARNPDGKGWTEYALVRAFKRSCARASVSTRWRFHDLRHYFVTALLRAGVGAHTVKQLAGHSHLGTTQRYAHAVETDLAAAIGRLQ